MSRHCRFHQFRTLDRDCQVADWKYGFPVPHKNICGKKGYDDDEGTPQPDQVTPPSSGGSEDADDAEIDTGIPAPEPSFKRSPALLHQISFHTEPDSFVDYVVSHYFLLPFLSFKREAHSLSSHIPKMIMGSP